jgi:hypothetical protein
VKREAPRLEAGIDGKDVHRRIQYDSNILRFQRLC